MPDELPNQPQSRLSRLANFLDKHPLIKVLSGLALVITVVGGLISIVLDVKNVVEFFGKDQALINRAQDILARGVQAYGADIGQKWALEHLHEQEKMPQRIVLPGAPLRQLDLSPLSDVDPKGADLQMAILPSAILEHAKLRCADLWHADLRGAFLTDAKLQYARLFGACLQDAQLDNADLTGADLTNADITSVDLRSVRGITREQLSKACADPTRPAPTVAKEIRPSPPWPLPCPPPPCPLWTKQETPAEPPQCPRQ